jgi:hypothetical protein
MGTDLTVDSLTRLFKERITELQQEPEFRRSGEATNLAIDGEGRPRLKLAVGNVPLDYDLWQGLRNPAIVGLHPAGLQEIWEFHANRRRGTVGRDGRKTIFQIPRSFDLARQQYSRAVIVSVMLPFSSRVMGEYAQMILEENKGSSHIVAQMYQDVNAMIDKATSRVGIDLVAEDTVVVPMDVATVKNVSTEAIPATRQGESHGPSKGGNYPQKSMAALLGLGQFGIARFVFTDEAVDGSVQRMVGPIRSMVIFDKKDLVTDGSGGVVYPTEAWREFLVRLYDFTDIDPAVNQYRLCRYIPYDGESCRECIRGCNWGALENSVPTPRGEYPERLRQQTHRFWEGKLQFDYVQCREEVVQMRTLFPEWDCVRCLSVCASRGNKNPDGGENFRRKMLELTID